MLDNLSLGKLENIHSHKKCWQRGLPNKSRLKGSKRASANHKHVCTRVLGNLKPKVFLLLAFLVPLIVRAVPEVLAGPYTLGFDTVVYYLPAMVQHSYLRLPFLSLLLSSSLFYVVSGMLFLVLVDPILTLKLFAPLLYGSVGLAMYTYARTALKWSPGCSFLAALLAGVSLGGLRISWDMHRNGLGLVFLFFTLAALHGDNKKIKLLAAPLAFFNTWAYEVTAVYMILILGFVLLYGLIRKNLHDVVYVLLALVASVPLLLYQLIDSSGAFVVPVRATLPLSSAAIVGEAIYFLFFLYFSFLPLVAFGLRQVKNLELTLWASISLFFAVPLPLLGVETIPHYRLAFMLSYPLAFYAAAGARAIKKRGYLKPLTEIVMLALILTPVILGVSYSVSSPLNPYLYTGLEPRFYSYMPTGMLQNTVPVSRTGFLLDALRWLDQNAINRSVIVLPSQFYGWALITISRLSIVVNMGELTPFNPYGTDSLLNLAVSALQNGASEVYTLWWKPGYGWYGVESLPSGFIAAEDFGDFAVYTYAGKS